MGELKILMFSEPFGCGHEKAAEALGEGLKKAYSKVSVKSIHAMSHFTPGLSALVQTAYKGLLKLVPSVWGGFYESTKEKQTNSSLLVRLYGEKMADLVRNFGANAVICTHPFPAAVLGALKERGTLKVPLAGVVTDFDVHSTWRNLQVDRFVLQHEGLIGDMVRMGVPQEKLVATGIPVHPDFALRDEKSVAKSRMGFHPDLPVIMVGGGGWGLGPIPKIIRELTTIKEPLQLVVLCGHNKGLHKSLVREWGSNPFIWIYGYVDNVKDLMNAADILISKPGGLTSCEALVQGIPMVTFEAFGGQETHNGRYLSGVGAALHLTGGPISDPVVQLLKAKNRRQKMAAAAIACGKPNSALDGARAVLNLLPV